MSRRPPALEEDQYDDRHEADRFEQRVDHVPDRVADVRRGVVGDLVVHAVREALLQLLHLLPHPVADVQGVGARELVQAEANGRAAVERADRVVVLRAELDPGDISQSDEAGRGGGSAALQPPRRPAEPLPTVPPGGRAVGRREPRPRHSPVVAVGVTVTVGGAPGHIAPGRVRGRVRRVRGARIAGVRLGQRRRGWQGEGMARCRAVARCGGAARGVRERDEFGHFRRRAEGRFDDPAVGRELKRRAAGLDHHVAELVRPGQPAERVERQLERQAAGRGGLPDAAGRGVQILGADRVGHVDRGHVPGRQSLRIEPDPHAVVPLPLDQDVRDPVHPEQFVPGVDRRVVAQVLVVVAAVGRNEIDDHQHVRRALPDRDPLILHGRRQLRHRQCDAVLDHHQRRVDVGPDVERHGQGVAAVVAGLRGHVQHALHPVHLLFDRGADRVGDFLGTRAGICDRDRNARGSDARVLRHRQVQRSEIAPVRVIATDSDGREDRPVDEVKGEITGRPHDLPLLAGSGAAACGSPPEKALGIVHGQLLLPDLHRGAQLRQSPPTTTHSSGLIPTDSGSLSVVQACTAWITRNPPFLQRAGSSTAGSGSCSGDRRRR